MKEDFQKELDSHSETRQKLSLVEKEAKSSSLMSMELEDYQKSIQALENGIAGKEKLLENARQESQVHLHGLQNMRKDMGEGITGNLKKIIIIIIIFFFF